MIVAALALIALVPTVVLPASPVHSFTLASKTFTEGATMPMSTVYNGYGCKGGNIPPELHWSGAPASAKSFALIAHDPDAPAPGGWWHWVVFNIPAKMTTLSGLSPDALARRDVVFGMTSFNARGYGGPCPPPGKPHHYVFTFYALDLRRVPGGSGSTTGPQLLEAIAPHLVGKAMLTGLYGR